MISQQFDLLPAITALENAASGTHCEHGTLGARFLAIHAEMEGLAERPNLPLR